ncbi:MAG: ATP-binding protein [Oligoflexia bacterium]|nr:ATP-binding protein [Oligoflexia bacterium]
MPLKLTPTNLSKIIEKAKFLFRDKLKNKMIELSYQKHASEEIKVMVDESSFANQVINNLISNAIKFSHENSTISISAKILDENKVQITIKDTGVGIPIDILQNIFDDQKKTTRNGTLGEKGTGFGMPLVKKFIELYHGQIEIESKSIEQYPNDHGSIIHIYLDKA